MKKSSLKKIDSWSQLSEAEKNQILAGLKDAKKGKVLTSKDFWKKVKENK